MMLQTEEGIAAFLHEMLTDYDPRNLDTLYWYERSLEILPKILAPDFISSFLETLPIEQQAFVIGKLAHFGHHEIAVAARRIVHKLFDRPISQLEVGIALMDCGDAEGELILRALYMTESTESEIPEYGVADHWRCELPVSKALLHLGTPEALALRFNFITDGMKANKIQKNELIYIFRCIADPVIGDQEYEALWCRELAPLLPANPLTSEFIDEALESISLLSKSNLLAFLARIGRQEVAETAARLVTNSNLDGIVLLGLGEVLIRCRDARGPKVLEGLYINSLNRVNLDNETVPCDWITEDVLREEIGTLGALILRMRLLELGSESKVQKAKFPPT